MNTRMPLLCCLLLCTCLLVLQSETRAQAAEKKRPEITQTERLGFNPGGTIYLKDSFGEVSVEGWDKPEVEIVITRTTQRGVKPEDEAKAVEALGRVKVAAVKASESQLMVTTEFPSRTAGRLLRGKTNIDLKYVIKVPQQSTLVIKHDIGEVSVANVSGDIEITSRIGEVSLRLPEDSQYAIDARSRIGEVNSEFEGFSQRQKLLTERLQTEHQPLAHRIFLRLGIGEIAIRKMPKSERKLKIDRDVRHALAGGR